MAFQIYKFKPCNCPPPNLYIKKKGFANCFKLFDTKENIKILYGSRILATFISKSNKFE